MIQYFYHPLEKDLPDLFSHTFLEHTLVVFPDETQKRKAWAQYQQIWEFQDVRFITERELTEQIWSPTLPLLEDIKRYLFLYLSMTHSFREKYECHDYFVSVSFINNIFHLLEEIQDHGLPYSDLSMILDSQSLLKDWQKEYWEDLLELTKLYQAKISELGYTDKIFLHEAPTNSLFLQKIHHIILINPVFYSNRLIRFLQLQSDKEIQFHYHIQEKFFDQANLKFQDFNIQHFIDQPTLKEKSQIYQSKNKFGFILQLTEFCQKHEEFKTIIDLDYKNESIYELLSEQSFKTSPFVKITHLPLYRFLNALYKLTFELIKDPLRKVWLIPLKSLCHFLTHSEFFSIISQKQYQVTQQEILTFFAELEEGNWLYSDLYGQMLSQLKASDYNTDLIALIQDLLKIISEITRIKNIQELYHLLHNSGKLHIRNLFIEETDDKTSEAEIWLESLVNLQSLDALKVFDHSEILFNPDKPVGVYLLSFIVEFVRGRKIRNKTSGSIEITDLKDSLGKNQNSTILVNLTEGLLPSSRKIPFIFTDQQRKALGLKSSQDIRLQEKYLFFRQILLSDKTALFTIENHDENIQISSFLEEILIYLSITPIKKEDSGYLDLYRKLLPPLSVNNIQADCKMHPDFFKIPFKPLIDQEPSTLKTSFYAWSVLEKNPFLWFITQFAGIKCINMTEDLSLDSKRLGIFLHEIMNDTVKSIGIQLPDPPESFYQILADLFNDKIRLAQSWYYKFPKNHDGLYFEEFLADHLIHNIIDLYSSDYLVPNPLLNAQADSELNFKIESEIQIDKKKYPIRIAGIVDLIVRQQDLVKLIDFKTGMGNVNQLKFYEMLHNLSSDYRGNLFASLMNMIKQEKTELKTRDIQSEEDLKQDISLLSQIISAFKDLLIQGCQSTDKGIYEKIEEDLIRLDAYHKLLSIKG